MTIQFCGKFYHSRLHWENSVPVHQALPLSYTLQQNGAEQVQRYRISLMYTHTHNFQRKKLSEKNFFFSIGGFPLPSLAQSLFVSASISPSSFMYLDATTCNKKSKNVAWHFVCRNRATWYTQHYPLCHYAIWHHHVSTMGSFGSRGKYATNYLTHFQQPTRSPGHAGTQKPDKSAVMEYLELNHVPYKAMKH